MASQLCCACTHDVKPNDPFVLLMLLKVKCIYSLIEDQKEKRKKKKAHNDRKYLLLFVFARIVKINVGQVGSCLESH